MNIETKIRKQKESDTIKLRRLIEFRTRLAGLQLQWVPQSYEQTLDLVSEHLESTIDKLKEETA
jgi:hypothetical protein